MSEEDCGSDEDEYCDATGRQRGSTQRWWKLLVVVDRDEVD